MKQGMGNSEACRIVGISRSSGTRWRHGRTVVLKSGDIKRVVPISHQRLVVISARFLSESERSMITDLLHAGRSIRAIAAELGRSPSTVSLRQGWTVSKKTVLKLMRGLGLQSPVRRGRRYNSFRGEVGKTGES